MDNPAEQDSPDTNRDSVAELLKIIKTVEEKTIFLSMLDNVLQELYTATGVRAEFLTTGGYPAPLQQYFSSLISQKRSLHPNSFRDMLLMMKKTVESMPVLSITLSFDPMSDFISYLSSFFRQMVTPAVILEFRKNSQMGGGVILEMRGLYRDYSLDWLLQQFFKDHESEIRGMVG